MAKALSLAVPAAVALLALSRPLGAQSPGAAGHAEPAASSWTGFYAGAAFGAGGAFNRLEAGAPGLNATLQGAGQQGVLGSIFGGFDYQLTERGLLGLKAEASYAAFNGAASASVPGAFAQVNQSSGFGWAVLLRAGFLADATKRTLSNQIRAAALCWAGPERC